MGKRPGDLSIVLNSLTAGCLVFGRDSAYFRASGALMPPAVPEMKRDMPCDTESSSLHTYPS